MAREFSGGKVSRVPTVDLNADVGEGCDSDDELLALVTSASIACGAHGGDERTMLATIDTAVARGVSIGAHPGYPDRQTFGRAETGASGPEIGGMVREQLTVFRAGCQRAGATFTHVKAHGAMYNRAMVDEAAAASIAQAVFEFDSSLVVLAMPGSALLHACEARGLRVAREAFLDRAYASAVALVPRGVDGAIISDPSLAAARATEIVLQGCVTALDGTRHSIQADSLCVHGDHRRSVSLLAAVRARLDEASVTVEPFSRS